MERTQKIDVNYLINAKGYDTTVPYKGAYPVIRARSIFQKRAYKMLFMKAKHRVSNFKEVDNYQFLRYLENQGIFRWKTTRTMTAWEAIVSAKTPPDRKKFTNVLINKDQTYWVRLSEEDFYNDEITDGYFEHQW